MSTAVGERLCEAEKASVETALLGNLVELPLGVLDLFAWRWSTGAS